MTLKAELLGGNTMLQLSIALQIIFIIAIIAFIIGLIWLIINWIRKKSRKAPMIFSVVSLIVLVVSLAGGVAVSNEINKTLSSVNTSTKAKSAKNTDNDESSTDDADYYDDESSSETDNKNQIELDDDKIDIKDSKEYSTTYSDSSWAGTTVKIDKVTVYKTDGEYSDGDDGKFNGIAKVHFDIKAGRDISMYASQATLNTNDGQQVDADTYDSDDFDGDLNSGAHTDGDVYFLLPKLDSVSSLKTLRLKFTSDYDTDDYDDDNSDHSYDVTVNLQ
ncbi:DUF4352 domain-containing protein [Pediococcus pentosaceus]|nr:DUF4352 domain-containing protein [Pediococcus pentosaceus]MBF7103960.1 DUF4352 domain-containing protein [Pediococcus pentosaceus]QQC60673.1 DUF4352 domain-containing protein [Pediococcus pentosaceus]QQC62184.1 DUF4352 domain-containing protein [Pediococcus pentosaceus]